MKHGTNTDFRKRPVIRNTNDLNLRGPQRFFNTGTQLHSHWGIRVLVSRWLPRLELRRNHYEPQRHRDHREDNEASPVKVGAAVTDSAIMARFLCELCASVVQNLWFRPQAGLGSIRGCLFVLLHGCNIPKINPVTQFGYEQKTRRLTQRRKAAKNSVHPRSSWDRRFQRDALRRVSFAALRLCVIFFWSFHFSSGGWPASPDPPLQTGWLQK